MHNASELMVADRNASAEPRSSNLVNEHQVARSLAVSVASVRRWRLLKAGPKYIKIGAAVRYKPEDIRSWIESQPAGGSDPTSRDRHEVHA